LDSLTANTLLTAAQQVQNHQKIVDSGPITLLNAINRIGATSPGSDEKKSHMLTQLKSSMVHFGCPIIFLTLNPGEGDSPISLYYAGEAINLKTFAPELWSRSDRLKKMLENPLAMVEYFHTILKTIIEGPLKHGLFGEMHHYYGIIEYQGRGTPHIHLAV
jgi:Helitron helicase-like domain at N-terminus